MFFSDFIKKDEWIGVTAPSDGNRKEMDFKRLELAKENLNKIGFNTIFTSNVYTSAGGRSSSKEERAEQFMQLIRDDRVKWIISAKGGDFLMEMLPLIDFEQIRNHPKWIQGYSDNTGLLFPITTICDIATVYGSNFNDFAITPRHVSLKYNLELMCGESVVQESFDYYEDEFYDKEDAAEGYREEKTVKWSYDGRDKEVSVQGRLIGGCLDVLLNLIGTRFDQVSEYCRRYQKDGILWYIESFALDAESVTRGLWQMREAGWFENASGFVFGRPCMFESFLGYSYQEAVLTILKDLSKPILFDVDIGHKNPTFTIINGAVGKFTYKDGKGKLEYIGR